MSHRVEQVENLLQDERDRILVRVRVENVARAELEKLIDALRVTEADALASEQSVLGAVALVLEYVDALFKDRSIQHATVDPHVNVRPLLVLLFLLGLWPLAVDLELRIQVRVVLDREFKVLIEALDHALAEPHVVLGLARDQRQGLQGASERVKENNNKRHCKRRTLTDVDVQ
jgi:hypothetical protein